MSTFQVQAAIHLGRNHFLDYRNLQDAFGIYQSPDHHTVIAVISDGCSSADHAETGAQLSAQFIIQTLKQANPNQPLPQLITNLFQQLLHFYRQLVDSYQFTTQAEQVDFISQYLLCTVMGMYIHQNLGCIFYMGDGMYQIDDQPIFIDYQNRPPYPAYHVINPEHLKLTETLPSTFEIVTFNPQQTQRVAIGSDAWAAESTLLSQVWDFPTQLKLKLQINQWSAQHHFLDDVSLILAKKPTETQSGDLS